MEIPAYIKALFHASPFLSILLLASLIYYIIKPKKIKQEHKLVLWSLFGSLFIYTLLQTKTIRFLLPLLVLFSLFISFFISDIFHRKFVVIVVLFLLATGNVILFYHSLQPQENVVINLNLPKNSSIYLLGDESASRIFFYLKNEKYLNKNNLSEILCSSTYHRLNRHGNYSYVLFSDWNINLSKKVVPGYLFDKKKIYDEELKKFNRYNKTKIKTFIINEKNFTLYSIN